MEHTAGTGGDVPQPRVAVSFAAINEQAHPHAHCAARLARDTGTQGRVSAEGRGRRLLGEVLAGYGDAPPLLPETVAWMVRFSLDKNLARPDSPFTPRGKDFAARLLAIGAPDAFVTGCLL